MPFADDAIPFGGHLPARIQSLPDELLRDIFEHAADLTANKLRVNLNLLPTLLTTCTVWRENAFATPRLWSFINFTYMMFKGSKGQDIVLCNMDAVSTHLQYSQLHTFDLCVNVDVETTTVAYDPPSHRADLQRVLDTLTQHLSPHARRCTSLTIIEEGQRRQAMFVPPSGLNNLHRFKLKTECCRSASELFPARLYVRTISDEECDTPLFSQLDSSLDTLDVDIMDCLPGTTIEGLTVLTFKYAAQLRGLRRLKVNADLYSASSIMEAHRIELHDLEVLALVGTRRAFRREVCIVAPNLLHLAYTPCGSWRPDTLWHFPKLIELEAKPEESKPPSAYHDLAMKHLPSLRTLTAHPLTIGLIILAANFPSIAPALNVLRVHEVDEVVLGAVLPVLEARQDIRVELDPGTKDQAVSLVPSLYRARFQAVAERWVETSARSIVERFFEAY